MLPLQGNLKRESVQREDQRQARVRCTVFQTSDAKFETWVPLRSNESCGSYRESLLSILVFQNSLKALSLNRAIENSLMSI